MEEKLQKIKGGKLKRKRGHLIKFRIFKKFHQIALFRNQINLLISLKSINQVSHP